MRQAMISEIPVSGEEGRAFEAVEDLEDVLITGTASRQVRPDLAHRNAPFTQPPDFGFRDVFVSDEHAA